MHLRDPHALRVVEIDDGPDLSHGVKPVVAQMGPNQGRASLLDEAIVTVLMGSAPGQFRFRFQPAQNTRHVVVEELRTVVGVNLSHVERGMGQNLVESIAYDLIAASQDGPALGPGRGHIGNMHGVDVLTGGAGAAVMDQVNLEVPRFLLLLGSAFRRGIAEQTVAGSRLSSGKAGLVLSDPVQDPLNSRYADPLQLLQQLG